jgi:hypothetical protein
MTKTTWIPTAIAVLACTICIAVAQQPAVPGNIPNAAEEQLKQQPQLAPVAANALPGRYQALPLGNAGYFLVIDTHTGHCWSRYAHMKGWTDLGSPVAEKE